MWRYFKIHHLTFATDGWVLIVDEGDVVPGKHLHQGAEELGELTVVTSETGQRTIRGSFVSKCCLHTTFYQILVSNFPNKNIHGILTFHWK